MRHKIYSIAIIFSILLASFLMPYPILATEGTESKTIFTPCGSEVKAIIVPAGTLEHTESVNKSFYSEYPTAKFINDSSEQYDCFGYAFHMYAENKMDEKVLTSNLSVYLEDGSYE